MNKREARKAINGYFGEIRHSIMFTVTRHGVLAYKSARQRLSGQCETRVLALTFQGDCGLSFVRHERTENPSYDDGKLRFCAPPPQ